MGVGNCILLSNTFNFPYLLPLILQQHITAASGLPGKFHYLILQPTPCLPQVCPLSLPQSITKAAESVGPLWKGKREKLALTWPLFSGVAWGERWVLGQQGGYFQCSIHTHPISLSLKASARTGRKVRMLIVVISGDRIKGEFRFFSPFAYLCFLISYREQTLVD